MDTSMPSYSFAYLNKGWNIIPVRRDKTPYIPWKKFQTEKTTIEDIKNWEAQYKDFNIGIITGLISNLSVIDIDPRNDGDFFRFNEISCLMSKTGGGGYHIYCKYNRYAKLLDKMLPGIDIKSDGGYVVAPPSTHPTGNIYEWLNENSLANFPFHLFFNIEIDGTVEGKRNDKGASLAGTIFNRVPYSMWDTIGWEIFNSWNENNFPPLSDKELTTIFNSIKDKALVNEQKTLEPRVEPLKEVLIKEAGRQYHFLMAQTLKEILETPENDLVYLVEGMIFEKSINLISGQTGVGKSMVTQLMASKLSLGEPIFGRYGTGESRVLFLDRENELPLIKHRFEKIISNKNNIYYMVISSELTSEVVSELISFIQEKNIDVIIVDSLIRFQTGKENDSNDISRLFSVFKALLKHLKCILIIHHLKKLADDQKADNNSARGSSDITASVDTHFVIEGVKDSSLLVMRNLKNRFEPKLNDITFKITSQDNCLNLEYVGEKFDPIEHKSLLTKRLIIEVLKIHPNSDFPTVMKYVSNAKGYGSTLTRKILNELEDSGIILVNKDVNLCRYLLNTDNLSVQKLLISPPQQTPL